MSTELINLFKEFKNIRQQYASAGANDSELDNAIVDLINAGKQHNVVRYWKNYLFRESSESLRASIELVQIAQKICDNVSTCGLTIDEVVDLYNDFE